MKLLGLVLTAVTEGLLYAADRMEGKARKPVPLDPVEDCLEKIGYTDRLQFLSGLHGVNREPVVPVNLEDQIHLTSRQREEFRMYQELEAWYKRAHQ